MQMVHPQITKSYKLAKQFLAGVADPVGSSIFEHGLRVYSKLSTSLTIPDETNQIELDILSASLLHDVLEDSSCSEAIITNRVNSTVSRIVKELTISFENKSLIMAVEPLRCVSSDAYLIKLSDMIDNSQKTQNFVKQNGPSWYYEFYFPLLREYSKINKYQISKMYADQYVYLDQAIILQKEFNRTYKSLKHLVQTWDSLNADRER